MQLWASLPVTDTSMTTLPLCCLVSPPCPVNKAVTTLLYNNQKLSKLQRSDVLRAEGAV